MNFVRLIGLILVGPEVRLVSKGYEYNTHLRIEQSYASEERASFLGFFLLLQFHHHYHHSLLLRYGQHDTRPQWRVISHLSLAISDTTPQNPGKKRHASELMTCEKYMDIRNEE